VGGAHTDRWIFGYASLVWRPAFAFEERAPAFVRGWARRFWQGSPDHRGTPHAPGRVATLVPDGGARCWGMAYRVRARTWAEVVGALDRRESGGFARLELPLEFADGPREPAVALVYVAGEENPNFLGPAPARDIARQVRRSRGHSGSNAEYVLRLAEALREHAVEDAHVAEIAALLGGAGEAPRPARAGP